MPETSNSDQNPSPAAAQDTAEDDGRTWLARLVGVLLLIAPLFLVYLLISLWPRPEGSIQCKPANQDSQAQEAPASEPKKEATPIKPASEDSTSTAESSTPGSTRSAGAPGALQAQPEEAQTDVARLEAKIDNLQKGQKAEQWAPCATISPFKGEFHLSADIRLLILVLLVGALGAFVHAAQSYATYLGNRKFKKQWTWWYILRIPIGSLLALFIYFTARGGLLTGTTPASRTDDLNIFGIMSFAALAGLFSKQVVDKLSEVVSNLFQSEQDDSREDKATAKKDQAGTVGAGGASEGEGARPAAQR